MSAGFALLVLIAVLLPAHEAFSSLVKMFWFKLIHSSVTSINQCNESRKFIIEVSGFRFNCRRASLEVSMILQDLFELSRQIPDLRIKTFQCGRLRAQWGCLMKQNHRSTFSLPNVCRWSDRRRLWTLPVFDSLLQHTAAHLYAQYFLSHTYTSNQMAWLLSPASRSSSTDRPAGLPSIPFRCKLISMMPSGLEGVYMICLPYFLVYQYFIQNLWTS